MPRWIAALIWLGLAMILAGCKPVDAPGGFGMMLASVISTAVMLSVLPFYYVVQRLRGRPRLPKDGPPEDGAGR